MVSFVLRGHEVDVDQTKSLCGDYFNDFFKDDSERDPVDEKLGKTKKKVYTFKFIGQNSITLRNNAYQNYFQMSKTKISRTFSN